MRRVKILKKGLSDADVSAVAVLAASAGCSGEEIEVVPTIGEPVPDCDDEILLVVMSPAICSDPSLEEELLKAQRGGRRAICIWPEKGETLSEPPSAAKKICLFNHSLGGR